MLHLCRAAALLGFLTVGARADTDAARAPTAGPPVLPGLDIAAPATGRVRLELGFAAADRAPRGQATVEVRLPRGLSLIGGAQLVHGGRDARPGGGVAWQARAPGHDRLGLRATLVYRAEGLTEPEGELEAALALARGAGDGWVALQAVYGQDPEGAERDAEVAASYLRPLSARLAVGATTRGRRALGSRLEDARRWDAVAVGYGAVALGAYRLELSAGGEHVARTDAATTGALVVAGVGADW